MLDEVSLPWAAEFEVTDVEGEQILLRLRANRKIQPRIEGMVRVQGSQYGYLIMLGMDIGE